jgi:peptidoglycan/LPS O-acetylase OafA/YrhL
MSAPVSPACSLTHGRASLLQSYYPSLDGLRALAFLAVFCWHYARTVAPNTELFHWGWAGVDIFFVLSGFLITGILFDTLRRRDFFRSFYIRRALRIFPLYYTIWIGLLLVTPVLHILWNRYNVAMAFYVGNLFIPGANSGLHPQPSVVLYPSLRHPGVTHGVLVDHFWSLCVEEQFYLVWPAIVWFLRSRTALLYLCLAGAALCPVLRLTILHFAPGQLDNLGLYYPTYVRCDSLLLGSALALWLRAPGGLRLPRLKQIAMATLAGSIFLLVLGVMLQRHTAPLPIHDPFVCTVGYSLIAIAGSSLLVLALYPDTWLAGFLQLHPLVSIGRISYGLYVIHELIMPPLESQIPHLKRHHIALLYPVISFAICWVLAALSFRYLESPFLRLKDRLARRPGAVADPPPSHTSLAAE